MTLPSAIMRCERREGASEAALATTERILGHWLPSDYRHVLLETDGFEGFVDPNDEVYVMFWKSTEIAELNKGYLVEEYAPGLVLLGTNGGGTAFGFIEVDGGIAYVSTPLIGMGLDPVTQMGRTFQELVGRLVSGGS